MLRVRELSDTEESLQTAFRISSFFTSLPGFRRKNSKTRNAFGSTARASPALISRNSRSLTSNSPNLKTNGLLSVTIPSLDFRKGFEHRHDSVEARGDIAPSQP